MHAQSLSRVTVYNPMVCSLQAPQFQNCCQSEVGLFHFILVFSYEKNLF